MSTITITRPAALLHTTGEDLKALFGAVLAHISPDENEHPFARQIHVEVHDGDLRLVCTDRFTMGIVRRAMTSTTKDFTCRFAIPVKDIQNRLEYLDDDAAVTFTFEKDRLLITTEDSSHNIPACDSALTWRDILSKVLEPEATPIDHILIDPAFLARLESAKPLAPATPMQLQVCGKRKAVIATLGTDFLGLVMPVSEVVAPPGRPLDGWFDLLDETPSA